MKIPNKGELQQTAFNYSSDIHFKDFMNLYKKCTAEPYSLLALEKQIEKQVGALKSLIPSTI